MTVPLGLQLFLGQQGQRWELLMAAATISMVPTVILVLALQKYLVRGIALSGTGWSLSVDHEPISHRSADTDPSPAAKATGRRNRMSVTDDAITSIRHMILTGELAPGDRLPPEADLAANLGLSRTSLREAVRALTMLGVIDTRQGDGSYITGLGPELLLGALGLAVDLQREDAIPDLVAVRRILEPAATALAATRVTAVDLEQIRSYIRSDLTRPGR